MLLGLIQSMLTIWRMKKLIRSENIKQMHIARQNPDSYYNNYVVSTVEFYKKINNLLRTFDPEGLYNSGYLKDKAPTFDEQNIKSVYNRIHYVLIDILEFNLSIDSHNFLEEKFFKKLITLRYITEYILEQGMTSTIDGLLLYYELRKGQLKNNFLE